jgi:cell division protein ZapA
MEEIAVDRPRRGQGLEEFWKDKPDVGIRSFVCGDGVEPEKKSAKVTIFGSDYSIKATEDPAYIERIARYVDGKMRELQGRGTVSSSTKIAILAAMNIADELHRAREARDSWQRMVDERATELAGILGGRTND